MKSRPLQTFGNHLRAGIAFLIVVHFIMGCSTKPSEDFCVHGHGQTIIRGRVLDFYTKRLVDSVQISIVWNSSWDHLLDTLIKQNDSILFAFDAPDDCEPYFITLHNKHYWFDLENHPAHKVSIDKGAINNFEIEIKPATFFKVNVTRDTLNNTADTVLLHLKKSNTADWKLWEEISSYDFNDSRLRDAPSPYVFLDSGTQQTISAYYDIEGNFDYDVRWVTSGTKHSDTLYHHFHATPFDTVQLDYRFGNH
jgi:hypothetical protein